MKHPKTWALTAAGLLFSLCAFGQSISGIVSDAKKKERLSYVTISLKRSHVAVLSNELGEFELHLPEGSGDDSLVVNAFGYRRQVFLVSSVTSPLQVNLLAVELMLDEVVVRPQPPEYYIRESMRHVAQNYPANPFETVAYYREKVKENGAFLKCDEGVFRSYCRAYLDTARNQDQLILFRRAKDLAELQFMLRDREKEKKKAAEKGKPAEEKIDLGLSSSFGGPESVLRTSRLKGDGWTFLDTTELDEYRYQFEQQTYYNDRPLMVISFKSRGKVDHLREEGTIYLDVQSFAIVRIENTGTMIIPVMIRPIIFAMGFGVTNPDYHRNLEFSYSNGRWYPQQVRYDVDVNLTKRYWFAPNDHSHIEVDQVFMVNKLMVSDPAPVDKEKRFNPKKDMSEQVHNDLNLNWDQVNVVRM